MTRRGSKLWSGAALVLLHATTVLAQPRATGSSSGGGATSEPNMVWVALGVVVIAAVIWMGTRGRIPQPVLEGAGAASSKSVSAVSTFALRAVAGTITWLGGLAALLGLGGAAVTVMVGAAADQGLLGLLGAAVPATGGGVTGLVMMAMGQLLACIAAIEVHARVIAQQGTSTLEETARLRAVVMGRLPKPDVDVFSKKRASKKTTAADPEEPSTASATVADSEKDEQT